MEADFGCSNGCLGIADWNWCTRLRILLRTCPTPFWVWDCCLHGFRGLQFVFLFLGFAQELQRLLGATVAAEFHVRQETFGLLPKKYHAIEHADFICWEHSRQDFWNAIGVIGAPYLPRFKLLLVLGLLWPHVVRDSLCCPFFSVSFPPGLIEILYCTFSTVFSSSSPSLHIFLFQFDPFSPSAGWCFPFVYIPPRWDLLSFDVWLICKRTWRFWQTDGSQLIVMCFEPHCLQLIGLIQAHSFVGASPSTFELVWPTKPSTFRYLFASNLSWSFSYFLLIPSSCTALPCCLCETTTDWAAQ